MLIYPLRCPADTSTRGPMAFDLLADLLSFPTLVFLLCFQIPLGIQVEVLQQQIAVLKGRSTVKALQEAKRGEGQAMREVINVPVLVSEEELFQMQHIPGEVYDTV